MAALKVLSFFSLCIFSAEDEGESGSRFRLEAGHVRVRAVAIPSHGVAGAPSEGRAGGGRGGQQRRHR